MFLFVDMAHSAEILLFTAKTREYQKMANNPNNLRSLVTSSYYYLDI